MTFQELLTKYRGDVELMVYGPDHSQQAMGPASCDPSNYDFNFRELRTQLLQYVQNVKNTLNAALIVERLLSNGIASQQEYLFVLVTPLTTNDVIDRGKNGPLKADMVPMFKYRIIINSGAVINLSGEIVGMVRRATSANITVFKGTGEYLVKYGIDLDFNRGTYLVDEQVSSKDVDYVEAEGRILRSRHFIGPVHVPLEVVQNHNFSDGPLECFWTPYRSDISGHGMKESRFYLDELDREHNEKKTAA